MYRGAMRSIFSELARLGRLSVIDEFRIEQAKTKHALEVLSSLGLSEVLVITDDVTTDMYRATRNIPMVDVIDTREIDPYSLIGFSNVLITKAAMDKVAPKAGVKLAPDYQLTQAEFLALVKAAKEMGITPIVQGIGDRPYPGSYLLHELLLRKLGPEDYAKLWDGKLAFTDRRGGYAARWIRRDPVRGGVGLSPGWARGARTSRARPGWPRAR